MDQLFLLIVSKEIFTTNKMTLVQTYGVSTIVACAQVLENEHPWSFRYVTHGSPAHAERKTLEWKGFAKVRGACRDKYHLVSGCCYVTLIFPSSKLTDEKRFLRCFEDDDHGSKWRYVLSYIWLTFWCVELVRARQNDREISHSCRTEMASTSFKNRCAPEMSKIIPWLKWVFYVNVSYATAGIRQFRVIIVAPNSKAKINDYYVVDVCKHLIKGRRQLNIIRIFVFDVVSLVPLSLNADAMAPGAGGHFKGFVGHPISNQPCGLMGKGWRRSQRTTIFHQHKRS